jgi:predicted DNA-binding transcriptional regulator AlpA
MSAVTPANLLTQPIRENLAELLDDKAVARLLSCSARHIRRLADRDAMPRPLKIGALTRWRRADIDAWITAGCPTTARKGVQK